MELDAIYEPVNVIVCNIRRDDDEFVLGISFEYRDSQHMVVMTGVRDIDCCSELFEAQRLFIKKNDEQLEYGRYTLGFSGESYSEIICDDFT